jgi:hypothetical protein
MESMTSKMKTRIHPAKTTMVVSSAMSVAHAQGISVSPSRRTSASPLRHSLQFDDRQFPMPTVERDHQGRLRALVRAHPPTTHVTATVVRYSPGLHHRQEPLSALALNSVHHWSWSSHLREFGYPDPSGAELRARAGRATGLQIENPGSRDWAWPSGDSPPPPRGRVRVQSGHPNSGEKTLRAFRGFEGQGEPNFRREAPVEKTGASVFSRPCAEA